MISGGWCMMVLPPTGRQPGPRVGLAGEASGAPRSVLSEPVSGPRSGEGRLGGTRRQAAAFRHWAAETAGLKQRQLQPPFARTSVGGRWAVAGVHVPCLRLAFWQVQTHWRFHDETVPRAEASPVGLDVRWPPCLALLRGSRLRLARGSGSGSGPCPRLRPRCLEKGTRVSRQAGGLQWAPRGTRWLSARQPVSRGRRPHAVRTPRCAQGRVEGAWPS